MKNTVNKPVSIARGDIVLDAMEYQERYQIYATSQAFIWDTETETVLPQRVKIAFGYLIDVQHLLTANPQTITFDTKIAAYYDLLSSEEKEELKNFCKNEQSKHVLVSGKKFNELLLKLASNGVALVGHNIAFDIGAIATDYEVDEQLQAFRFKLCSCGETGLRNFQQKENKIAIPCSLHPTVIVKQLRAKKHAMYFECDNYAPIVDTITLGNVVLGAGASSLNAMLTRIGMHDEKKDEIDYDKPYTLKMYQYASKDVQLTCKLFLAEYQLYKKHDVKVPYYSLMSEASLGKAYEEKLGIPPFKFAHPEIKPFLYGLSNRGYKGAVNEANIRKQIKQIRYCDFKSQYPLVNALLDTQRFYLAEYIHVLRDVEYAQRFVDTITIEDLLKKETWKQFIMLVKINCNRDYLPEKGIEDNVKSFGMKIVKDGTIWSSVMDAIRSKLYTGRTPEIIDAYILQPSEEKITTNIVKLFSDERFTVDLSKQDFYVNVIDLRDDVKSQMKSLKKKIEQIEVQMNEIQQEQEKNKEEYIFLSNLQLALKLLANSSSYGIRVETREIEKQDIAGKYNAMPIGVHITSGARLLLGIADTLGKERGLIHCFCDTDSYAYVKPDYLTTEKFYEIVDDIINKFMPLSPYRSKSAIFEIEDVNKWNNEDCELFAYCVSTKRYVLFNLTENNKPRIRKFTEHGLVSYVTDRNISLPHDVLQPINQYWRKERYLMWYRAIELELRKENAIVNNTDECMIQPAFTQTTVSTPSMYSRYNHLNIRPFCFFCITPTNLNKKEKQRVYFPLVLNQEKLKEYMQQGKVRDIETNQVIHSFTFETIAERYKEFFNHSEAKYQNGNETGIMKRREVSVSNTEIRTRSGKKVKEVSQLTMF